eukprot:GHVL01027421.1.p1 GENE.GHVL01027421.1~~GHVL01027421.1.p1  ORF type:complete len:394 (+),score=57.63 GHVL01027421.1:505-1686(+)
MPIQSYNGFKRMVNFCKTNVPKYIYDRIEPIKDDEQAVKDFGIELATHMCRELMRNGVEGLHFYTLNLEVSVMKIICELDLFSPNTCNRTLPWRPSTFFKRSKEDVRPIFWSNRPQSYVDRTATWDEFPNGRFGNRDSAAYGDYNFVSMNIDPTERSEAYRLEMWGNELVLLADIANVFCNFIKGKIPRLPWCSEATLEETKLIDKQLLKFNSAGYLTINSQPRANTCLSSDHIFGWGPVGGFVYQKAYLEFFCSIDRWKDLLNYLKQNITISYMSVTKNGDFETNVPEGSINAVTWGVFPNCEVKQPTVVDVDSFLAWKDEAFALWKEEWACLYPQESKSNNLLLEIHDNWCLVNIVDNDFVSGDLFGEICHFCQNYENHLIRSSSKELWNS